MKLFILGFPGLYGGAGAELRHQIHLWHEAFPEIEMNIIPTHIGCEGEDLYREMIDYGVKIHRQLDFSILNPEDAVISFCSSHLLENLEEINHRTKRVLWVNCMTYLFPTEKKKAHLNLIQQYLYQRPQIRDEHAAELKLRGSNAEFNHFVPYFNPHGWVFSVKDSHETSIGRISRKDKGKFHVETIPIYEAILSSKVKRGYFLGFEESIKEKIGDIPKWISTYADQNELSVKTFYDAIDFIVQPTDTLENWPRIGFEAMFSGKPLVVDNRGGWQHMIEHGISGFLCDSPKEFSYWGTRLAQDIFLRQLIAINALKRAKELSSFEESKASWAKVFERAFN